MIKIDLGASAKAIVCGSRCGRVTVMSQLDEAKKEGGDSRLGPGPVDRSDIVKFQLQQAVETYRSQISFVVQIYTILVLADVYVTGFALTAKAAAVVGLG